MNSSPSPASTSISASASASARKGALMLSSLCSPLQRRRQQQKRRKCQMASNGQNEEKSTTSFTSTSTLALALSSLASDEGHYDFKGNGWSRNGNGGGKSLTVANEWLTNGYPHQNGQFLGAGQRQKRWLLAQCSPRGIRRRANNCNGADGDGECTDKAAGTGKIAKRQRVDFAKTTMTKMLAEIDDETQTGQSSNGESMENGKNHTKMEEMPNGERKPENGQEIQLQPQNGTFFRLWENVKAQLRSKEKQRTTKGGGVGDGTGIGGSGNGEHQKFASRKKGNCIKLGQNEPADLKAPLATIDEEELAEEALENKENFGSSAKEDEFIIFCARIHLREGHGLAVRDASGSSDPYVKCQYAGRTLYRSETVFRELNPNWDEEFAFLVEDPTEELTFKVFDYDRFMKDDFMGSARITLSTLSLFQKMDFKLPLDDPRGECPEPYLGYLQLSITFTPLTTAQKETFMDRSIRGIVSEQSGRRSNKTSTAILSRVNILLVEANLSALAIGSQSASETASTSTGSQSQQPPDTHVRCKLGIEKFKSKSFPRSWQPKWLEQFELHVFDENFQTLDLSVCDSRTSAIIGRCSIDLNDFEPSRTIEQWHHLEQKGTGSIHLLMTISPSTSNSLEGVLVDEGEANGIGQEQQQREWQIAKRYKLCRSFHSLKDIGCLIIKVYEAEGLAAADLNGKSDPFCVLELVNLRAQTQTDYKTLNPKWDRAFTFFVKDIHESLELTVFDEDPNKRAEFLGKIVIPLLKIRNGEKRWYGLKDRKLNGPAKGRILIEAAIHFNYLKAAIRTFKPKERKLVQPVERFKRAKFLANINRLRAIADQIVGCANFAKSCLSWQSYPKSICALIVYIIFVTFVQLWHFPLLLLLLFLRSYGQKRMNEHFQTWANRRKKRSLVTMANSIGKVSSSMEDTTGAELENEEGDEEPQEGMMLEDQEDLDGDEEEIVPTDKNGRRRKGGGTNAAASAPATEETTKSLKGRIQAVQEILVLIQNKTDFILGLMDRIKNTLNFTVPFLSFLAMFVFVIAILLLFLVPLRWILLLWGINKFSKKLRDPNYVDNNEVLDFLSRIPTDKEIRDFRNSSRLVLGTSGSGGQMASPLSNGIGNKKSVGASSGCSQSSPIPGANNNNCIFIKNN